MALTLKVAFWVCFCAVVYNYVGYPILLFLLGTLAQAKSDLSFLLLRKCRRASRPSAYQPTVAILISAFNEESVIKERVRNILEIDYPSHLVEVFIGLDAPTDSTAEILSHVQSPRVHVFHFESRRGKLAVISDLSKQTSAEILVFTDANTMFAPDCVSKLTRHFNDSRVGAVSGEEIRVSVARNDPAAEGLYWRYESALKILESRLHCLHSANGGVYAIRRALFRPQTGLIVEDFQIPLDLRFQGFTIIYDPDAIAIEEIAPTFTAQFERRIRLGAGNFQTLFGCPGYLNPFKGLPSFSYWSHRVLRWLTPLLLIIAFVCTAGLLADPFYRGLFIAQSAFYALALFGHITKKQGRAGGLLLLPLNFCSMNIAMLFGLLRYLGGRQSLAWTATPRQSAGELLRSKSPER